MERREEKTERLVSIVRLASSTGVLHTNTFDF